MREIVNPTNHIVSSIREALALVRDPNYQETEVWFSFNHCQVHVREDSNADDLYQAYSEASISAREPAKIGPHIVMNKEADPFVHFQEQ